MHGISGGIRKAGRLVKELKKEGKSREEAENVLIKVFLITAEEAKEKVKAYWQEGSCKKERRKAAVLR